jgi:hypothetical protein
VRRERRRTSLQSQENNVADVSVEARVMNSKTRWLAAVATLALPLTACDTPDEGDGDDIADPSAGIDTDFGDESGDESGDASSGSEDSSTGEPPDLSCGEQDLVVDVSTPQVVLVLDKSHSMVDESWDHDGIAATPEVTRWHSLHGVTVDLVESLERDIAFGAVLFPSAALTETTEATACVVEAEPDVAIGLEQAGEIVAALPGADELEIHGGTPTRAGIETALEALRAASPDEPRAMVLVTDGAANCSEDGPVFGAYDEALAPLVAEAAAEGIPTYVVGIDIVDDWVNDSIGNPHERMSEVAIAGGAPREGAEPYYVARDEHALRESIDAIAGHIQCRIELPDLPDDPDLVHFSVDEAVVPWVDACGDDGVGWRYTDDGAVELCSASCDDYGSTGTLHARFDCVPEA